MIEARRSEPTGLKKLLYILTMLLIIFLAVIIVLACMVAYKEEKPPTNDLCTSKNCIRSANRILRNIDESVDPCENFYQFTCGLFNKNNRIKESQSKISEFSKLRDEVSFSISDILSEKIVESDIYATQNAKSLYASCMNRTAIDEKGLDFFFKYINEDLGGWPILGQQMDSNVSIIDKLIMLKRTESSQIFEVFVSANPKNPTLNILRLVQPSWFFNKQYLENENVMKAYREMITTVLGYLVPDKDLTQNIDEIIKIEEQFSNLQKSDESRRNITYQNYTIRQLIEEVPEFDWKAYIIDGMYGDIDNVTITEDEIILVDDIDYIKSASVIYSDLKRTKKIDFENLLIWLYVKDNINFLPRKLQQARLDFEKVYLGRIVSPKRSLLCSNLVNSKMEDAVGRLYVTEYFDKTAKKEAIEMVSNLLHEFKDILAESDWMDSYSKSKAIEKAEHIDVKIGYAEKIYNDTYLNDLYKGYDFSDTQFYQNHHRSLSIEVQRALLELRKKVNPKQWISGAAVVNAFYSPSANQICFPAGILQKPFYDGTGPKYLNYGGIGTVIGHEITHGFDDVGRMFDKDGVYFADGFEENLWSNNTIMNYKKKVQCIIDQYNNYTLTQVNKTINGLNTQGENIADNGGLKESFKAYKNWASKNAAEPLLPGLEKYNQEQLFFINFGQLWCGKERDEALINALVDDSHSPGEFRVIGSTSNSKEFALAFKCKSRQQNNPTQKCSVW